MHDTEHAGALTRQQRNNAQSNGAINGGSGRSGFSGGAQSMAESLLVSTTKLPPPLDPFDVILGERIKERRLALGMSQIKLSALSTVGIDALNSIERGRRNPSLATLRKIARTLECTVCDLLPGKDYVDTIPVKSLIEK